MTDRAHVLIVDDETNVRKVLAAMLEGSGYTTSQAASGDEALEQVRASDPDLVLTDLKMPGMDGLELLRALRSHFTEIPVVMLTAHGTVEAAVEAMKNGAHDFLTKPFDKQKVLEVIAKAVTQAASARREFHGPFAADQPCGMVGRSASLESLRRLVRRVAPSDATVLVTGETGTGKELVAEALHRLSSRRERPLVNINCGALPETLVEAELFGHERGAFTGADRARAGRFELADGGTLFLDEIGEMPPAIQVKLLRVLQDGMVDRVGGTKSRKVDVRLIAATNRDLGKEVDAGRFRQDLLFRLRVVEIAVPSLAARTEDIPLLVEFFIAKHSRRLDRPQPRIGSGAMEELTARTWPGNIRELENAVERAVLLAESAELTAADFGIEGVASGPTEAGVRDAARAAAERTARRLIKEALEETGGNVTHAAERLNLSRRGLQIKMKELGLRS